MTPRFRIRAFQTADQASVEALVLSIQRDEFGLSLTAANQPDLSDIAGYFATEGSAFWVASPARSRDIVGCIGLEALPGAVAVMRKFMVRPDWRGSRGGLAAGLHDVFKAHAIATGARMLALSTVTSTHAAQAFYLKAGYKPVARDQMPVGYEPGRLDSVFMLQALNPDQAH